MAHKLKVEGVALPEHGAHALVHHLNVRLVHAQRLRGQAGGLVDGDVMQLRVAAPAVLQNEEQLLRAAQRNHRDEAVSAARHDVAHLHLTLASWTRLSRQHTQRHGHKQSGAARKGVARLQVPCVHVGASCSVKR